MARTAHPGETRTRSSSPTPTQTVPSAARAKAAEYTIDELSAVARVPSRTIRFYQSKGALTPPEIRGRVAYYGRTHVERLKLIAQLQDRGLRIDAIRGLLESIDRGELDVAEWLGIEQQLRTAWSQDAGRTLSESELLQLVGSDRAGLIADLTRLSLIERREGQFLVGSPALLAIAMKLEAAGVGLDTAAEAAAILQKHLRRALEELSKLFLERARKGSLDTSNPAKLFEALRPLSGEAVRLLFGKLAEQSMRRLLASGALTKLPRRSRRAAKRTHA